MKVHPFTPPAFGSLIAGQAGILAAILRGPTIDSIEQPPYALLISEKKHEIECCEWGVYGREIAGASSRSNGTANTRAMAAAGCAASLKIVELAIEGHQDWFLASLGEMNSAANNTPELFDPTGVYWTSTQSSRHDAFVQGFASGDSHWGSKGNSLRVRPFRRISLELLNA